MRQAAGQAAGTAPGLAAAAVNFPTSTPGEGEEVPETYC